MHAINWGIQVNRGRTDDIQREATLMRTQRRSWYPREVTSASEQSDDDFGWNAAARKRLETCLPDTPDQKNNATNARRLQKTSLFEHKLQQHATTCASTSNYSNWECRDSYRRSWLRASVPKVHFIHLRTSYFHIYLFTLLRLWFWHWRDHVSRENGLSWNECKMREGVVCWRGPSSRLLAWFRHTDWHNGAARFIYVQPNTTLQAGAAPQAEQLGCSLSALKAERKDCVCANIKEEEGEVMRDQSARFHRDPWTPHRPPCGTQTRRVPCWVGSPLFLR